MEDITDVNYRNTKRVLKDCNNKKIGDYRNLYIESDILILADVFGNFGNIYIDIYELDSANFLSVARLPQRVCLKTTEIRLELPTYADKLLMVEK